MEAATPRCSRAQASADSADRRRGARADRDRRHLHRRASAAARAAGADDRAAVAAVVLLAVNVALLARIDGFAWHAFRLVAGLGARGLLVIAGMLEYVFIYDHTRGIAAPDPDADAGRLRGRHSALCSGSAWRASRTSSR